jgi:hypothetical protein
MQIVFGFGVGMLCLVFGCWLVSSSAVTREKEEGKITPTARLFDFLLPAAFMFFMGIVFVVTSLLVLAER